jgi:RimJ/RimL family protein N-acetyltransferase
MTDIDKPMLDPQYPIETERLLLRPYKASDLDALHRLQSLPEVVRYLLWGPRSRAEVVAMLEKRTSQTRIAAEGDKLILAVTLRDGGALIGNVNLRWLSAEHRQGETGFVLLPEYHGKGYGREAARAMLALGFGELGLHRIIGRCDARNAASARLMERLGMRHEAHLRENEMIKGEWADECIYAILAAEWRAGIAKD